MIIGILTVISLSTFQGAQRRSRDVTRKGNVLRVQSSLEQYRSSNNRYAPTDTAGTTQLVCPGAGIGGTYVVSTTNSTTVDPLFVTSVVDPNFGYLLRYMERPSSVSSTISEPAVDNENMSMCNAQGGPIAVKTSRIGYAVYSDQYWVYVALENKGEVRVPKDLTCYHSNDAAVVFHDAVFPAFQAYARNNCDSAQYKMFARGNLIQPSQ